MNNIITGMKISLVGFAIAFAAGLILVLLATAYDGHFSGILAFGVAAILILLVLAGFAIMLLGMPAAIVKEVLESKNIEIEQRVEKRPNENLADPSKRMWSYFIDLIAIGLISLSTAFVLTLIGIDTSNLELGWPIGTIYFTYFFARGKTPGMELMKIRLIGIDGTYPVSYKTALIRAIGMIISELILFLGYLMILVDKKKQALHDKLANTLVINE